MENWFTIGTDRTDGQGFGGLPYALAIMLTTSFTKGFCTFTDRVFISPSVPTDNFDLPMENWFTIGTDRIDGQGFLGATLCPCNNANYLIHERILHIYRSCIVLSPYPCFIPSSVFYPLIRVLPPHPCFIPSSVFYPLIRVLSPHPCFIPSSVFYPLIRVLSPHPCFIPSSVFYPLIRIRPSVSGHPYPAPCFIPTRVTIDRQLVKD